MALHGGTAINLFVRNMPRISVDIDLTYLPIEDRLTTLNRINEALERIKSQIEKTIKGSHTVHNNTGKLLISLNRVKIKLEVNLISRGTLPAPTKKPLCDGMSKEKFSYDDFEQTREKLVKEIKRGLTEQDKTFLLSIKSGAPDWSIYNFEYFPAVQWKLQNLKKLKNTNPQKHEEQYQALKEKLYIE